MRLNRTTKKSRKTQRAKTTALIVCIAMVIIVGLTGNQVVSATEKDVTEKPLQVDRMDVVVSLNSDGSANITEYWNMTVRGQSEAVRNIVNLGKYTVYPSSILDERGKELKQVKPWDSNVSKDKKENRCGIRTQTNGDISIHWGLSEDGEKAFTLDYKQTGVVRESSDGQYIMFTLIGPDTNMTVDKVYLNIISTDVEISNLAESKLYMGSGKSIDNIGQLTANALIDLELLDRINQNENATLLVKLGNEAFNIDTVEKATYGQLKSELSSGNGLVGVRAKMEIKLIIAIACGLILLVIGTVMLASRIKVKRHFKLARGLMVRIQRATKYNNTLCKVDSSNIKSAELFVIGNMLGKFDSNAKLFSMILFNWMQYGVIDVIGVKGLSRYTEYKIVVHNDAYARLSRINGTYIEKELIDTLLYYANENRELDRQAIGKLFKDLQFKMQMMRDIIVDEVAEQWFREGKIEYTKVSRCIIRSGLQEFMLTESGEAFIRYMENKLRLLENEEFREFKDGNGQIESCYMTLAFMIDKHNELIGKGRGKVVLSESIDWGSGLLSEKESDTDVRTRLYGISIIDTIIKGRLTSLRIDGESKSDKADR